VEVPQTRSATHHRSDWLLKNRLNLCRSASHMSNCTDVKSG